MSEQRGKALEMLVDTLSGENLVIIYKLTDDLFSVPERIYRNVSLPSLRRAFEYQTQTSEGVLVGELEELQRYLYAETD